jgi:hypothetical protein
MFCAAASVATSDTEARIEQASRSLMDGM